MAKPNRNLHEKIFRAVLTVALLIESWKFLAYMLKN
jgi:hypothetical protein